MREDDLVYYCIYCGARLSSDAQYCTQCGSLCNDQRLEDSEVTRSIYADAFSSQKRNIEEGVDKESYATAVSQTYNELNDQAIADAFQTTDRYSSTFAPTEPESVPTVSLSQKKQSKKRFVIIGLVIVVAIVLIIFGIAYVSQMATPQDIAQETQNGLQEDANEATADGVKDALKDSPDNMGNDADSAASDSNSREDGLNESEDQQAVSPATVPVRDSLKDYSWDELGTIAQEISDAKDEYEAMDIAANYNLCGDNWRLDPTQTKSVKLADGLKAQVHILGFYHDTKTSGGKSGITFCFTDCISESAMSYGDSNAGGWASSRVRDLLNEDLIDELPSDLQKNIVEVKKLTNNVGETTSTSSVTETNDKLWILSDAEMQGTIDQGGRQGKVLAKEGFQYQLFAETEIDNNGPNAILIKRYLPSGISASGYSSGAPCTWWQRSATPLHEHLFQYVATDGNLYKYDYADLVLGVAPAFCL